MSQAVRLASGPKNSLIDPRIASRSGMRLAHDVLVLAQHLVDVVEELAAAVGAFHLAVAEQVQLGQQLLGQDLDAVRDVVAPVVAVGEVEGVDVPLVRRIAGWSMILSASS